MSHLRSRCSRRRCPLACLVVLAGVLGAATLASAATVVLEPVRDNTLFADDGSLSNGAGSDLFSGMTGTFGPRRALFDFDIAGNVPPGATINSVQLQLVVSQSGPAATAADSYALHRVTADWGEAGSNAGAFGGGGGGGGAGAPAQASDATWTFARYNTVAWSVAGGDHVAPASASTAMPTSGGVLFGSAQLAADVADMLNTPSGDHGWILIGNESASYSARKFYSRESATGGFRPKLTIDYTPGALQSVVLEPVKDTSLYEYDATKSNGAGPELFSGRTDGNFPGGLRRALLEFDVAGAIPPGSTIADVTLALNVIASGPFSSDTQISTLHRLSAPWGEGNSGAGSSGNGSGSPAQAGADATWTDRFYMSSSWLAPGGDFIVGASASFATPKTGSVTVPSSAALVADVADWLANPASNYGWILRGDEAQSAVRTARRWHSRESSTTSARPKLTIQYSAGTGGGSRGGIPDGDDLPGVPLRLSKLGGDDVRLSWSASCKGDDTDYSVYEGAIGSWYDHAPVVCSTGGALVQNATVASTAAYLLVVPNDGSDEGSYGDDSGDTERPFATSPCLPQNIGAPVCP